MLRKLAALCLFAIAPLAGAQTWPDRPIRFIMSAPAGSSIDVLGRADRRQAARTARAAGRRREQARSRRHGRHRRGRASAPDGYTMVLAFNGPLAFAPLLQKLPYDVQKDLAPVIITTSQPNVLAVNAAAAGRRR